VAGYEVGIRVGEFLGQSHYKVFHTTGTAGTIAAAVAAGRAINLPPEKIQHAIGSAGTQAAGLWEFLKDAANSKQLHAAKAAFDGLLSALLAEKGFSGAKQILEGAKGMAAGMSQDADPARLTDRPRLPRMFIKGRLMYSARSMSRRVCIRRSFPWVPCWVC
jgi:2-methylcitrate dehydratase PrpD